MMTHLMAYDMAVARHREMLTQAAATRLRRAIEGDNGTREKTPLTRTKKVSRMRRPLRAERQTEIEDLLEDAS